MENFILMKREALLDTALRMIGIGLPQEYIIRLVKLEDKAKMVGLENISISDAVEIEYAAKDLYNLRVKKMRKENRLDFPIPSDTKVWKGFDSGFFGFKASPGDMVVERLQNQEYLGLTNKVHYFPYEPTPYFQAKVFKVKGYRSDNTYTVEVSDECIYVVETKMVYKYCDNRHLTFGGIVKELQRLLV